MVDARRPIGMFDSGVGGLTVARAVIDELPHEDLIYFGDTARCPYGPRPRAEVKKFALQIMDRLVAEDVKVLVIACNAASSSALEAARERYDVPIIDVIQPGAKAAVAASRNRHIGVIGTQVTIDSGAYPRAIAGLDRDVTTTSNACPRFVEFVERGDTTSDELLAAAEQYLEPLKKAGVDTLILGCTHYPLLAGLIQYVMGPEVLLISSAQVTANEVYGVLKSDDLLSPSDRQGAHRFVASDAGGIFSQLGKRFLGPEFGEVEHSPWEIEVVLDLAPGPEAASGPG
ncbi:MAG: glutamate racemase [Actinomycetota bacterium]